MIQYSFVRMRICSHILYILANITLRRRGIWDLAQTTLIYFSNTTREKIWKLCSICCNHIFPQMYSLFPQWRRVSSGFMEKENICDNQQRGFEQTNNLVFCYTLICNITWSRHLWTVNMFYLKNIFKSQFKSIRWSSILTDMNWSRFLNISQQDSGMIRMGFERQPLSGVVNKLYTLKSRYILLANINIILTRLHSCTTMHIERHWSGGGWVLVDAEE